MEVWGAQGSTSAGEPGWGGYAYGQIILTSSQILYICVGPAGRSGLDTYNGNLGGGYWGQSGGGATNIAITNRGELKKIFNKSR